MSCDFSNLHQIDNVENDDHVQSFEDQFVSIGIRSRNKLYQCLLCSKEVWVNRRLTHKCPSTTEMASKNKSSSINNVCVFPTVVDNVDANIDMSNQGDISTTDAPLNEFRIESYSDGQRDDELVEEIGGGEDHLCLSDSIIESSILRCQSSFDNEMSTCLPGGKYIMVFFDFDNLYSFLIFIAR